MSREHWYYGAIRKTLVQFANIFTDIKVAKYDTEGHVIKYIKVPVKFAPKDTSFYNAFDSRRAKVLPIIAMQLFAINHDPLRIGAKSQRIPVSKDVNTGLYTEYLSPVPYNFDFQIDVISNYQIEMDQILEQILAYFNPFTYVRIRLDEYGDHPFDLKVLYTSSNPNTPTEQDESNYRIISWTLYFTVYGYLFTPVFVGTDGLVKDIITKYYTSEANWAQRSQETMFTSGGSGSFESESVFLRAIGYDDSGDVLAEQRIFSVEDYALAGRSSTPTVPVSAAPTPLPSPPIDLGPDWLTNVTRPQHLWTLYKGNWQEGEYGVWTYTTGRYPDVGTYGNIDLLDTGTGTIATSAGVVLDGNGYLRSMMADDVLNSPSPTFTLFADFTCTNTALTPCVMAVSDSGQDSIFEMYIFNTTGTNGYIGTHLYAQVGSTHVVSPSASYTDNERFQVIYTQEASIGRLYVNGSLVATETLPAGTPQSSNELLFCVGAASDGTGNFTGIIKRIAVLKGTALSQADITALYAGLT